MALNRDQIFDYAIAGGGLQGCLLALAIRSRQPEAAILLVEQSSELCGNHTWSFHASDIAGSAQRWFSELVDHQWSSYQVRFNGWERSVPLGYGTILSQSLARKLVNSSDNSDTRLAIRQAKVTRVTPTSLELSEGGSLKARAAFDCRGRINLSEIPTHCGFQKFVGLEIELNNRDWLSTVPTVMDADISQEDGFRFVYCLPFSKRRVLVEDTRFANNHTFSKSESIAFIKRYLDQRGIKDFSVVRDETGCLPMPYSVSRPQGHELGYRGNLFHAATGYSMPLAANLADQIASATPENAAAVVSRFRRENRFQAFFARFLNRMLFCLVRPEHRHRIFERFYRRLPLNMMQRFYGHRFNLADAMRLVVGRPPSGLTPFNFVNSFWKKPCPIAST